LWEIYIVRTRKDPEMRRPSLALSVSLLVVLAGPAFADTVVTDRIYVRHDGGSDAVIRNCANDAPGNQFGGNLPANEPALAIKPDESSFMVASANDYCIGTGGEPDSWQGVYVSSVGGSSWIDSLLPGYPGDTSREGRASPLFGTNHVAADPILDWDNDGNLFAGGIAFNRTKPINGNTFVATYHRDPASPLGIDYLRTVITGRGTPGGAGRFHDKPSLKVDDWTSSPHEGNVYVAWTIFPGTAGNFRILFSRSTDTGRTFSKPIKLSPGSSFPQGSDIAVAPDGTVYVFWRQFRFVGFDAIVFTKSTDGGQTFSKPQVIRRIVPYDRRDEPVGEDPDARDCGDGAELCASNFVFHRARSLPQATVDDDGNVYATWEEVTPAPDNGDTYHPDGQSQVVVTKSTNAGGSWSNPVRADPQSDGHQWWPNIEYDKSRDALVLIYYDSRTDPSYSPNRPPGNLPDATSVCGTPVGSAECNVLNTFVATSSDGVSWSSSKVSSVGHQPEYEMFADRQVPFHGDYIWVDSAGGNLYGVWTDNRDVVPGEDPREEVQDGFDVKQCRQSPTSPDTCANAGGLNQNIYGGGLSIP
jgi:hypothetical protein